MEKSHGQTFASYNDISYRYHDNNLYSVVVVVVVVHMQSRNRVEFHRKQASTIIAVKPTTPSSPSTYSRSVISPLKLTLIQSNSPSIVSGNYPNAVNQHVYRWPLPASTTTTKSILYAKKPDSNRQTGTNDLNAGTTLTSTEETSTQHATVDHRARPYHHHTGLG